MANTLLPIEERTLTPDQVELLDKRRRRGQLFLVLCFQTLIVGTLVTLWAGQDWTLSPGWTNNFTRIPPTVHDKSEQVSLHSSG